MANKVVQYRYYGRGNDNNYPLEETSARFCKGDVFLETLPILQLGIQTMPGTKFYVNVGDDPIIIGSTGIYELDLQNKTEITSLRFGSEIFDIIDGNPSKNIKPNPNAYLIVDIVFDEMEA